jgi:hypothetical protein
MGCRQLKSVSCWTTIGRYNTSMNEAGKLPKRRRPWMQFGLRNFLVIVTILCLWLGWYLYRVERQRKAVRWVLENSGEVYYDYQFESDGKYVIDGQPPGPKWLHNKARGDKMGRFKRVVQALRSYHRAKGHFPPAIVYGKDGRPWHSWRVLILPFLGYEYLYKEYDQSLP